jgi:phosphate transport system protein
VRNAYKWTLLHYGLTPWGCYGIVGMALGYFSYNRGQPLTIRSSLQPILGRAVEGMLKDVLDAYIQRDVALAADVIARDVDVDQKYNALFRELLTFMMEDPGNITPCLHLHFIAKNTERMGDLVSNIAEQVVYLVTGAAPDENRPKGDISSTDLSISKV